MDMLSFEDFIAIQNLIHSYPARLDAGDLRGLGELFSEATVYFEGGYPPVVRDPGAITRMFGEFLQLYEGVPRTRHIIANLILESDGPGRARSSSTVVVFQQTEELPLQAIITGDYQDRFEKSNGVWHFAERHIRNDLFGNLSAHGRYSVGPNGG